MLKIGEINDTHLGLKTEEIDRTDEIYNLYKDFAKACKKAKVDCAVIGGDIFNKNNPSEELIAVFIMIMNLLAQLGVPIYIVVGNHDAIANPDRLSCLSFIKKLKKKYPMFHLIEDITCIEIAKTDIGPLYYTFLPHVSRALLEKKKFEGNTQDYIDKKAEAIYKRVGQGSQHIVFSHLNVKGVIMGSEENLLNKSEVFLPDILTNAPMTSGYIQPEIIQAHIHTRQQIGNVHIIGNPLFCGFGEKIEDKYFAIVNVPTTFGEKFSIDYIPTNCTKFYEFSCTVTGRDKVAFEDIPEIKEFLDSVEPESVIKISPTILADKAGYDWSKTREKIAKSTNSYVKEIIPRYIKHKVVRDKEQSAKLTPKKAVHTWLKRNKPPRAKTKFALAKKYIEETL